MKKNILYIILFFTVLVFGQQKQPKIGLVLSGGGAKGFAHIGVLKEIDKANIKLDYIGGTSMGAIIGGLYAVGFSGNQIEKIIKETNFLTLLRDQLPRSSSPFFDKEYGEKTAITLPVKNGKIGLPKAISKGQNVLNFLFELFDSAKNINHFNQLPIPFFCIATDVETGSEVVLEKGSLPLALRASGSFPTLLNPVNLHNKLLVDGGVSNNFPVSFMKSKKMDIIIGVDVEGKLAKKEKLTSAVSILNQIVSYQMYSKSNQEKTKLDVYIHPDIYEFSVVDFDKKDAILKKGNIEAIKYTKVFKEIAAKQNLKSKRKELKINTKKRYISKINITGLENYTRSYVLGKLNIKIGDSISRKQITKKIHLLSATKNYETITYNFINNKDNTYQLNFNLTESKDFTSLKLGAHYDFIYRSSILANYSRKHFIKNNDLLSLDLILGDNLRYNFNYFVDNGFYLSYGFKSRYNHFRANSKFKPVVSQFTNVSSINLKYTDITNQFFVQTTFDRKFALSIGLEHKNIRTSTETITTNNQEFIIDRSNYFNVFGSLKLDTYNKKYFETSGFFADLSFKWYLASSNFNNNFKPFAQTKGTLGFATPISNNIAFKITNQAGFTLNGSNVDIFDFYLGGYNKNFINTFFSFYGYDFAELSNKSFIKTEFNLQYNFAEKHYASFISNFARLENNVFENLDVFKDIKSGYALGYSYHSFIGPIELKYSWSPDNKQSYWLFNLGYWF